MMRSVGMSLVLIFVGVAVSAQTPTLNGTNHWTGINTFPNLNGVIYIDGTVYPRTAAGVQAAVNALGGNPGTIMLSPGAYAFGSTTVAVSNHRQNIIGFGKWTTEIDFCGPGIAFKFSTGSNAILYQNSLSGMAFNGACDTSHNQKIAVQLVDTSEFKSEDIAVLNWSGSGNSDPAGTPSMGFDLKGRELTTLARMSLSADRPINMDLDPNLKNGPSSDALHIIDFYGIPSIVAPATHSDLFPAFSIVLTAGLINGASATRPNTPNLEPTCAFSSPT